MRGHLSQAMENPEAAASSELMSLRATRQVREMHAESLWQRGRDSGSASSTGPRTTAASSSAAPPTWPSSTHGR